MANVILPSTGGGVLIAYKISQCSGNKNVTFTKPEEDSWYTITPNVEHEGTLYIEAEPGKFRSSTISSFLNGVPCETIIVEQKGDCDCSSIENIDFNYIIPPSGSAVGTIIGTYTVARGCQDKVHAIIDDHLDLTANEGKFILNYPIQENPSTSEIIIHEISVFFGTGTTPCGGKYYITQEATSAVNHQ
jgi:hypothetical protein